MYIETRFFDKGIVKVRLHKGFGYPNIAVSDEFDTDVESIGDADKRVKADYDNSSDYESLEAWSIRLIASRGKRAKVLRALETGDWVDITRFV